MSDISNINWRSANDKSILEMIGNFIRETRLGKNKTQQEISSAAGISRSTIVLLEKGGRANLSSLIAVLRVLEQLHLLQGFQVQQKISPLQLAELEQKKRKRARRKNKRRQ